MRLFDFVVSDEIGEHRFPMKGAIFGTFVWIAGGFEI